MTGQFLLARYVSNLERGETKNIGVIVWTKGAVASRFVAADSAEFIEDRENFERWVAYWQDLCAQPRIQVFNDPPATNKSARFLKALQSTQRGNYRLEPGGVVMDDVTPANINDATSFLFSRIVAPIPLEADAHAPTLTHRCLKFLQAAGVAALAGFTQRYEVTLQFPGFKQEIHCDFGFGKQKPAGLFNRVNPSKEDSVTLAAGKFQSIITQQLCERERCYSLYDSSELDNVPESTILFLRTFSVPLDIAAPDAVQGLAI